MPTYHKLARLVVLAMTVLCSAALFLAVNAQAVGPVKEPNAPPPPPASTLLSVWLPIVTKGDQWSPIGDMPSGVNRFYDLAACGLDDKRVLFAATNNGVYLYDATQNKWLREDDAIPSGKIVPGVTFVPNGTCMGIYAASAGGIWYGHLEGSNWQWQRVDEQLSNAYSVLVVENTLYAAGNFGIATISPLPTTTMTTWALSNQVTTLTLSLTRNGNKTLAAVWGQGVFVEGKDPFNQPIWTRIGPEQAGVYEADTGTQNVVIAGTDSGLRRWTAGSQWQATGAEFPNSTFAVKAVEATLYAGQAKAGVLRSFDGGLNWFKMNDGLTSVNNDGFQVRGFHIGTDGKLYAATTAGAWQWSGQP